MSTKETGATFNLMPGSLNSRDDQYAQQLKLLQFLLWKNLHYFTGTEVENSLLSTYPISQLIVSPVIHCDGSPPAPLSISSAADVQPSNSLFEEFVDKGGLAVLSNYLLTHGGLGETAEEMVGILTPSSFSSAKRRRTGHLILGSAVDIQSIPSHTLAAFNIFLGIPLFAKTVLQDQRRATMLVRLALSVSDDEHGGNTLSTANTLLLPSLPFVLFQSVLDNHPPDSMEVADFRQQAVDKGALKFVLAILSVFTQQVNSVTITFNPFDVEVVVGSLSHPFTNRTTAKPPSSQQQFWAKGTGYGSGSTTQSWDVDEAMQRQKYFDEQAVCLIRLLAAFIHPSCSPVSLINPVLLPVELMSVIQSSHLIPALCSYLRNDSMMYVSEHIPIYKAIFHLLRAFAASSKLSSLLVPPLSNRSGSSSESQSIFWLLRKLRNYVPRYAAPSESKTEVDDPSGREEGITELSEDLCTTWTIVKTVVISDYHPSWAIQTPKPDPSQSPDKHYCDTMQSLLFDSYAILIESSTTDGASVSNGRFTVSYHFENNVRNAGERCHPNRMKRLAQEVATLKTSLPLSASSSIFVRCDTDRVDIMKVLITGPADTPYSNGCFEFDVYFPPDYPQVPMRVHFVTTGRQSVRFNPNLYMDGRVCLSVLNTWTGQPEEMWNPQTSSLLQVIISIQSLILVSEPYFNEPGLERSRGAPSGDKRSRDYNANIRQATVNLAMLEQIKNPSPCFKEVIHTHFSLKRKEIEKQCEDWISDMEEDSKGSHNISSGITSLKLYYGLLKDELARLSPPAPSPETSSDNGLTKLAAEGLRLEVLDDAELFDGFLYDDYSEDGEEDISEDALNAEKEDEEENEIDK